MCLGIRRLKLITHILSVWILFLFRLVWTQSTQQNKCCSSELLLSSALFLFYEESVFLFFNLQQSDVGLDVMDDLTFDLWDAAVAPHPVRLHLRCCKGTGPSFRLESRKLAIPHLQSEPLTFGWALSFFKGPEMKTLYSYQCFVVVVCTPLTSKTK